MTPFRRAMWISFAVQLAGFGFDGWWHSLEGLWCPDVRTPPQVG